jgi:hypothetical protein
MSYVGILQLCLYPLAYLLLRKTEIISDIRYRRVSQVAILYLVFPLISVAPPYEIYATFVMVIYVLINVPECIIMFICPWAFITAIILVDLWAKPKRESIQKYIRKTTT